LPPTLPTERKGEEKEAATATARARARNENDALSNDELRRLRCSPLPEDKELHKSYVSGIPTRQRAIEHARLRGFADSDFVSSWYDKMDMANWNDRHGMAIENWGLSLMRWFSYRDFFNKLQDPNRIPDAVSGGGRAGGKPVNWRGTRKEDLDVFFG